MEVIVESGLSLIHLRGKLSSLTSLDLVLVVNSPSIWSPSSINSARPSVKPVAKSNSM